MTVQWALAALFLYAEIIVLLLFCFPYISTERWNQIFKSRIVATWFSSGSYYFKVVVLAMVLLLADSIRQIIKYNKLVSSSPGDLRNNPQAEVTAKMNLFHAQRNLYISGFSLFLLIVLNRFVKLLSDTEKKGEDEVNQELKEMREALEEKSKELERTNKDLAALKEQAAGLTQEYSRLLEEHAKAQPSWRKTRTKQEKKRKTTEVMSPISGLFD